MYELFAALIIYSATDWRNKLKFAFRVFDFDGSHTATQDEMVLIVHLFSKAFSCNTLVINSKFRFM